MSRPFIARLPRLAAALALSFALALPALAAEKVNINTADAATLDRVLVNIGRAKAEAIVAHRKQHGPFRSAEQLAQVKGVGLRTVERNRDVILIGPGAPAAKPGAPAGARPMPPKPAAPARR